MGKRIGNFKLVNYKDHPKDERYKILNFNSEDEANYFEKLLVEKNHWFEKDVEMHDSEPLYLFAVKNREFVKIQQINFLVSAKFRSPMIKSKAGRYVLVLFFIIILAFSLVGYFSS